MRRKNFLFVSSILLSSNLFLTNCSDSEPVANLQGDMVHPVLATADEFCQKTENLEYGKKEYHHCVKYIVDFQRVARMHLAL